MRHHPIECDWCHQIIHGTVVVYSRILRGTYASSEGSRNTWDFCSDGHLTAWKDHREMRQMASKRTHRSGGPGQEDAEAYADRLREEIPFRVEAALVMPRLAGAED